MAKSRFSAIIVFALFSMLILNWVVAAQAKDLYKILGVDKTASQREIQKAFHRLSLKYHPDKNKAKDAQSKFAEISNAYDILSDEEKRKQYDMFGDEPRGQQDYGQHSSSFRHNGNPNGGQRFYTSEDMGQSHQQQYTYREQAGPNGFHFHFGGPGGGSFPFSDFMQDMFGEGMGNMFGEGMGRTFSKFKSQGSHHGGSGFKQSFFRNMGKNEEMDMFSNEIKQLNSAEFKTLMDGGDTSLILFFMPDNVGLQEKVSVLEEVARKYGNIVKVAAVNCDSQKKLCKGQKLKFPMTVPKLFVYPWIPSGKRDGLEYTGDWSEKALLSYFTQFLPRLSTRLEASNFDTIFATQSHIPKALLLTKKSETPAIWRYLSGSFSNRIEFFDMQIQSLSDPIARKFNLHNVPAVVGILANGEQLLLSDNIDHNKPASAAENLLELLKSLELKNKEAVRDMPVETAVPLLSKANIHKICSDSTPLCVIGVYKSKKSHDKLFKMLEEVSKKTLLRMVTSLKPSVSYCLLDGNKQSSFLKAFEDKNIRNQDMVLIAYKPRKGKFAVHKGDLKTESVETFITGSLSGDIVFQKLKQKPTLL